MNKEIKGIIVLLLMVAVMLIPLSVKAEMKVMTDNEMQMVTGEGVFFNFATSALTTALTTASATVPKIPIVGKVVTRVTPLVTGVITNLSPTVTPFVTPILDPVLNFLQKF
jgi:hypothetical protein